MTLRLNRVRTFAIVVILGGLLTDPAHAQSRLPSSAVSGGVPSGQATAEVLHLSLADAVGRGLRTTWRSFFRSRRRAWRRPAGCRR
jgi:hypothetical protein